MSENEIVKCPSCSDLIEIEDGFELGDIIYCSNCEAEMEVIRVYPIKLRKLEESEEKEEIFDFREFYGDDEDNRWGE